MFLPTSNCVFPAPPLRFRELFVEGLIPRLLKFSARSAYPTRSPGPGPLECFHDTSALLSGPRTQPRRLGQLLPMNYRQ